MDWNDDGLDDIIVGDRNGFVTFFRRTGSGVNDLTSEGHMSAGGTVIDVGSNSAPVVVDWNNDGLLDLLIGNESSYDGIRLYLNSGTPSSPILTNWVYIESSGTSINRYRCCPQVYDMNGDGRKDLIMGESGAQIFYYENTGTDADPVFSGCEAIQSDGAPLDLYSGTRLWVNDWDENGIPDLIVSDFNGYVYVFMAVPTGTEEETAAQVQNGFAVTPAVNPARGVFNINILTPATESVALRIYDSAGRLAVLKDATGLTEGVNSVTVSAGTLAAGVYTVAASSDSEYSTCRIVLTH